jgi:hypothetical protein
VPIDIEVNGKVLKFAFLEGMGEWYEREGVGGPYREFQPEIAAILGLYEFGISIIFVAPTVGTQSVARDYSHECLANTMTEYDNIRLDRNRDNILLLLSKWDAVHDPSLLNDSFCDASPSVVSSEIRQWFLVWSKFASLTGLRVNAKTLMPYSAVWTKDGRSIITIKKYARVFEKFNRTLWNWLYGNITEFESTVPGTAPRVLDREILYEDVVPAESRPGLYALMTKIFFLVPSDIGT